MSLIRQHAQKELSIFLKKRTMISLWMKKDLSISVHPDMSIKIDQPSQAVLLWVTITLQEVVSGGLTGVYFLAQIDVAFKRTLGQYTPAPPDPGWGEIESALSVSLNEKQIPMKERAPIILLLQVRIQLLFLYDVAAENVNVSIHSHVWRDWKACLIGFMVLWAPLLVYRCVYQRSKDSPGTPGICTSMPKGWKTRDLEKTCQ